MVPAGVGRSKTFGLHSPPKRSKEGANPAGTSLLCVYFNLTILKQPCCCLIDLLNAFCRRPMSSVEPAFGLTEEQRSAREEEELNAALVEIQLRDENSFPALGVSRDTSIARGS